jgi:hypothetical protein
MMESSLGNYDENEHIHVGIALSRGNQLDIVPGSGLILLLLHVRVYKE